MQSYKVRFCNVGSDYNLISCSQGHGACDHNCRRKISQKTTSCALKKHLVAALYFKINPLKHSSFALTDQQGKNISINSKNELSKCSGKIYGLPHKFKTTGVEYISEISNQIFQFLICIEAKSLKAASRCNCF